MPRDVERKIRWNKTRMDALLEARQTPQVVTIEVGGYLLDAMLRLPPTRPLGQGQYRAADWTEITGFAQATQRIKEPWEIEALFQMAQAFVAGMHTGEDLFGIEPVEQFDELLEQYIGEEEF